MSDSESEEVKEKYKELKEIKQEIDSFKKDPKTARMFVSGWDDDDEGIAEVKNPKANPKQHILWAAENGELATVENLLEEDPDLVNVKDGDGYTPLHRAAYSNHTDVISTLLSSGAHVAARTQLGWTPLHSATNWDNHRAADLLIHAGADVNAKSDGDQTPLHLASAISQCRSTLVLLLNHPEIVTDGKNRSGDTPKMLAQTKGIYGPLFEMVEPDVCYIKSREFTENPFYR